MRGRNALVGASIAGSGSAPIRTSAAGDATTCGTKIGPRAQQTQRAQFCGQGSAAERRVSSTHSSGITVASRSVLCTANAASQKARNNRTTLDDTMSRPPFGLGFLNFTAIYYAGRVRHRRSCLVTVAILLTSAALRAQQAVPPPRGAWPHAPRSEPRQTKRRTIRRPRRQSLRGQWRSGVAHDETLGCARDYCGLR